MSGKSFDVMHTVVTLREAFRQAGLETGMSVLMHSSMRTIGGWVLNGAESVVQAVMDVLTPDGTLMMPTHTTDNTDPKYWSRPPVSAEWWQQIREQSLPFRPQTTSPVQMGMIVDSFLRFPNVKRSSHPIGSFSAWGKHADHLLQTQPLDAMFGEESPLSRLYALGGAVLMLGVSYGNCTSLHLAEHRARFPKVYISEGTSLWRDNQREWVEFTMLDYDDSDFEQIGATYESQHHPHLISKVGRATTRLVPVRPLVDFATWWMSENRHPSSHLG